MLQQVDIFTLNTFLWEGDSAISIDRPSPAVSSHQILYFFKKIKIQVFCFISEAPRSNDLKFRPLGFSTEIFEKAGINLHRRTM